jgi:hypothetical protein
MKNLLKELNFHIKQFENNNIDKNDFINVFEDIYFEMVLKQK